MTAAPYRVLARKYRPQRFGDLIGQEAMVTTLGNAIRSGRLAQAWLLTGVRGVGKTSTARLIAKALNCIGPDGEGGPTIDPCGICEPCRAIAEGRFIDVMEQDAASNTQVDKMRELLDGVPYAAVAARYKIYVIDEVHMLSTSSFNALLKTLEEPPAHVKFIFATTEVQKLPVTILSRCQRFDLRRIPSERLAAHYAAVAQAEGVAAEPAALQLIARAAEGSARDGLSILDQAIAFGSGGVTAAAVQEMLGLADRGRVRALMSLLLAGDGAAALEALGEFHVLGVDPQAVLRDLMDLTHAMTRLKAGGPPDRGRAPEEAEALALWAERLGHPQLHRLWQLLMKGYAEVGAAPLPQEAAEMALLRIVHAAALPDPGELARLIAGAADNAPAALPAAPPAAAPPSPAASRRPAAEATAPVALPDPPAAPLPAAAPASFAALVQMFEDRRELTLALLLHDQVRPARYAPPLIELEAAGPLPKDFSFRVGVCLEAWTGLRWTLSFVSAGGQPTLREAEAARLQAVLASPAVKAVIEAFPGAEFLDYVPDAQSAQDRKDAAR